MPKLQERISGAQFTVSTAATPEVIREAGKKAMAASKRLMTSAVSEQSAEPGRVNYAIKGPGGLRTQMVFTVSWRDAADGHRTVMLQVGKYLTTRQTIMFIPVTPKRAPALGSLQRFSEVIRRELEVTK